jgi:UDP-N-acetylmuramoyl-tripeptide--D-alanyl-D-alanine ligase
MSHILSKKSLANILSASINDTNSDLCGQGVEFNSKEVKPGQIFFALKGSKNHGHDYLQDALSKGAALAVVEDPKFLTDSRIGDQVLVVEDSLKALQSLASHLRNNFKGKVVGVAGSVGKTTTKDLLGNISSQLFPSSWSKKSFNNLLGLSYTICNADPSDKLWVLELGMNHEGELAELSLMANPDLAIITQIAPEHMEFFRDLNHVADAEFEVLAGLKDEGALLLNSEDLVAFSALTKNVQRWNKSKIKVHPFGFGDKSELLATNFKHVIDGELKSSFSLQSKTEDCTIKTNLIGRHNAGNFSAAFLALKIIFPELKLSRINEVVETIPPSPMRLNQITLPNGALIIDDSYNSSPVAVAAAINIMKEIKDAGREVVLVLGDMYELGDSAKQYHLNLVPFITELAPSLVVTFGPLAQNISMELSRLGSKAVHAQNIEEVTSFVKNNSAQVFLFKASRGVGLDRAVKMLLQPR